MRKKLLYSAVIIVAILCSGVYYINKVVLPARIKSALVSSLARQTGKTVTLESLRFNIFKGLVVKNLAIIDDNREMVNIKEGDFAFQIVPFLKKQIVISSIVLRSPEIFLLRRPDAAFNVSELFSHCETSQPGFNVLVNKVHITGAKMIFEDQAVSPVFHGVLENCNVLAFVSVVPPRIKFTMDGMQAAPAKAAVIASGEYNIVDKALSGRIIIKDLAPNEFKAYYKESSVDISQGTAGAKANITFVDDVLTVDAAVSLRQAAISKDSLRAAGNADINAYLKYDLPDRNLLYSGEVVVQSAEVTGVEALGDIQEVNGTIRFQNSGLSAEKLKARVMGLPIEVRFTLDDFQKPLVSADINAATDLGQLQKIIKERFAAALPGTLSGQGVLNVTVKTNLPADSSSQIKGSLEISNGVVKLEKAPPIEGFSGRLEFTPSQVSWDSIHFMYQDQDYKSSGNVSNFAAPEVKWQLFSRDVSLDSRFSFKDNSIHLTQLTGRYLNSRFSATADIDMTDSARPKVQGGAAKLDVELKDIKEPLSKLKDTKLKDTFEKINPSGLVHADVTMDGDISDVKNCAIQAKLSGAEVSAYGLKITDASVDYTQSNGFIEMPAVRCALYDGTVSGSAKLSLESDNMPYLMNAVVQGVNIEKLKNDTTARSQDLAGVLNGTIKLNGSTKDSSRLTGAGTVVVSDGKLWNLNLFKGLGTMLFDQDFSNIIFSEGVCSFLIGNQAISTEDLRMKSNLANISGSVKIGFDSSLDATLDVEISPDAPLKGTMKDVTTAIMGQANKFGVIRVKGTLKDPKYKFKPAVLDILKGLKDSFFPSGKE